MIVERSNFLGSIVSNFGAADFFPAVPLCAAAKLAGNMRHVDTASTAQTGNARSSDFLQELKYADLM
jgi:hypothetical protein